MAVFFIWGIKLAQYRKKPVVIEAIQWTGNSNREEIENFIGCKLETQLESDTAYEANQGAPLFYLIIPTLEGDMKASAYDYIIKGVNGEFYPIKADIFRKTYDKVID